MDAHQSVRELPFPVVAEALGIDLSRFRQQKGEWVGYCAIHNSKSNNNCFRYSPDGKFHCFSCQAKGRGSIDLCKTVKGIGFKAAVELLAPLVGKVPIQQKNPPEANSDASTGILKPLDKDSWRKFAKPCEWLEKRITDPAIRERYGVFYYENPARQSKFNRRIMIPVKDPDGVLYGYLGRSIEPSPEVKYLFPSNFPKSRFLFGAHELHHQDTPHNGRLPLKVLYLVESPLCVMKFASLGLPAVSPFGWSVSNEQVELVCQLAKGVVYLPDRNKRQEASNMLHSMATRLWIRFPELPDGVDDPEHLSLQQVLAL